MPNTAGDREQTAVEQQVAKPNLLFQRLKTVWNWPGSFHWMAPLPVFHRRWILLLSLLLIILLLLPSPRLQPANKTIDINDIIRAELVTPEQLTPEPQTPAQQTAIPTETSSPTLADHLTPNSNNWKNYSIQPGQTLAQLFRDNNLPANDAFALAKVEGDGAPLSNLQTGQQVKLKVDDNNQLIAVDVELPNKQQAFFIRQPDGTFYRYH